MLGRLARSEHSKTNACRNIHTLVKREKGLVLPLDIELFPLKIMKKRPIEVLDVWWPMLSLKQWLSFFLREQPELILGGHGIEDVSGYEAMFCDFWTNYKRIDPKHEIFSQECAGFPLGRCVPMMLHGDEGRGAAKIPFLVLSVQPVISFRGPSVNNDVTRTGSC